MRKFKDYQGMKIGSFNVGNNIIGVSFDMERICKTCNENGFLSIIDFAALAPTHQINLSGSDPPFTSPDALVISSHKLIGGAGATAILAFNKKKLLSKQRPIWNGKEVVVYETGDASVFDI